jgi:hypothetical protein
MPLLDQPGAVTSGGANPWGGLRHSLLCYAREVMRRGTVTGQCVWVAARSAGGCIWLAVRHKRAAQ